MNRDAKILNKILIYQIQGIEAFYNTVRLHGHCGYRSPDEYEKRYLDEMESRLRETA